MSLMSCDHVTIIPSHSLIGQPFCRSATHFWKNFTHFNESCYTFSLLQIELLWYLGLPEWRIFGIQNTQSHSEKFRLASLVWVYSIYVGINFVLPSSTYLEGFFCNDNLQYIMIIMLWLEDLQVLHIIVYCTKSLYPNPITGGWTFELYSIGKFPRAWDS